MAKKKIKRLKREVRRLRGLLEARPAPGAVSPLAPAGGFPDLPEIGGVEFAAGAAGVHYEGRDDVMLVRVAPGCAAAGVFTRSATRSAPVIDCERKLASIAGTDALAGGLAILANSGNSNAFTGSSGFEAVELLSGAVAGAAGIPESQVFTASTGVIGVPLPAERIRAVVSDLARRLAPEGIEAAARAIMTTDSFPKGARARVRIGDTPVGIAGFAKGSGMIAPDMATMLSFIFTDAAVAQTALQDIVSQAARTTFNRVTVDGDTSTSDTLIVVATGRSGAPKIEDSCSGSGSLFADSLHAVMEDLAKQLARDGEGATKFVEVRVFGAASESDAELVAKSIANSPLVKTAVFGEDPNWGRVVMAIGKSGAKADRDRVSIRFGDCMVAESGCVSPNYVEEEAAAHMRRKEIAIGINLGLGNGAATVWTCDFSSGYVSVNADYRS